MFEVICVLGVVAWMVKQANTPYLIRSEWNLVYMDDNEVPPLPKTAWPWCSHKEVRGFERIDRSEPRARIYRGTTCAKCAKIITESEVRRGSEA